MAAGRRRASNATAEKRQPKELKRKLSGNGTPSKDEKRPRVSMHASLSGDGAQNVLLRHFLCRRHRSSSRRQSGGYGRKSSALECLPQHAPRPLWSQTGPHRRREGMIRCWTGLLRDISHSPGNPLLTSTNCTVGAGWTFRVRAGRQPHLQMYVLNCAYLCPSQSWLWCLLS